MSEIMLSAIQIGGDGLLNVLLTTLIYGVCLLIVYLMGHWAFTHPKVPPIVLVIWKGIFVLVGGIVLINLLLGLGGKQFIKW